MNTLPLFVLLVSMYNVCQYVIVYNVFFFAMPRPKNVTAATDDVLATVTTAFSACTTRTAGLERLLKKEAKASRECSTRTAALERAKAAVDVLLEEETEALKQCTLEVEKKLETLTRLTNNARPPPSSPPPPTFSVNSIVRRRPKPLN